MNLREYLAAKAVSFCIIIGAAIVWGVFAYMCGANAFLLWGSEGFFIVIALSYHIIGFAVSHGRLTKLRRTADELNEKYLLGELLPPPADAVEHEYFEIMRSVSRAAIGEVERAERDKNDYCDSVEKWIHEIKTPLTACSLICANGADPQKIMRELRKADNLTDTILQYARLRSTENATTISAIDVCDTVDDAVKSQRELLIAANISVTVDGGATVFTDGKALCFIVKQLLINCAKYCAGCHITITAESDTLVFKDDGVGIASYDLPRITERGFTGRNGKTASTGMGLYIVSELCKKLSVELDISSELGAGTTFVFTFASGATTDKPTLQNR